MHAPIAKEISSREYSVDVMNDEYPNSLFGLFLGNFFNLLVRKLTLKKFKNYFSSSGKRYDLIIIFKGRGMSMELLKLLSAHSDRVISYNWDSFGFFNEPLKWLKAVDSYKTFDFVDSVNYHLKRVDLFSECFFDSSLKKDIDISCVIKNHSDRLLYLDRIFTALGSSYSFYVYVFEKNFLTLIRNLLRHPLLVFKWRKSIHFSSLDIDDYFNVLSSSKATIDFSHPRQTGITMRCFQASACGTRVITNNCYVKNTLSLDPDNFLVFELEDDEKGLFNFMEDCLSRRATVRYRGIVNFVDELLD
jgi:hypothetical protein